MRTVRRGPELGVLVQDWCGERGPGVLLGVSSLAGDPGLVSDSPDHSDFQDIR